MCVWGSCWKEKVSGAMERICVSLGVVLTQIHIYIRMGFPGGSAGKESTCNAGDLASIPGLGRSLGEGKGYPLQDSGLENSMDCIVHGVTESGYTTERLSLSHIYVYVYAH